MTFPGLLDFLILSSIERREPGEAAAAILRDLERWAGPSLKNVRLYPTLQRLERDQFVRSEYRKAVDQGGPDRRHVFLTPKGNRYLARWRRTVRKSLMG